MIFYSSRLLRRAGAIVVGSLVTASVVHAVDTYFWTGAADSNYLNAANWTYFTGSNPAATTAKLPAVAAPGATASIVLPSAATNKVLNLNYTGVGDATYQIYALQTAVSLGYTVNLSGTSAGTLIYNIVGRGTVPYNVDPTTTSTGAGANRLTFNMTLGAYTKIIYTGAPQSSGGATSGLTYADLTMTGNASIDATGLTNAKVSTFHFGGLNLGKDCTINLGLFAFTEDGGGLPEGEEELWAGHITQDPTATAYNATTNPTGTSIVSQKWGPGITRVTATGVVDLPAGMAIRDGKGSYLVDGIHNGPISTTAGTLGGKGTINGLVTINNGTLLAPGGKGVAGKLTINGDIALNGTLSIDLRAPDSTDLLVNSGTTTIGATGNLAVGISDTFPLVPATYRILNTTNGGTIIGSFRSVAMPSASWAYTQGANFIDVYYVQLSFNDKYPDLGGNQKILAAFVDKAIATGVAPTALVDSLNRKDVIFFRNVIDQLSPATYYSWYPAAVERTSALLQTLDDRIDQRGERLVHAFDTYVVTSRQESSIDRSPTLNVDYSNFDTVSVLGGVDYVVSPLLTLGGLIDYSSTDTDLDTMESTSTTDSYTGALYAQHRRGAWQFQAVGFLGKDSYKAQRNVLNTTLASNWAKGKADGTRLGGSLSGAYTYRLPWLEITPTIGVQVLDWRVDGFTETEANQASLELAKQFEVSLASRVGLRLAQSYKTARGFIRPYFSVTSQHEFYSGDRTMKANVFGERVSVKAIGLQPNGMRYDLGLDWDMTRTASLQVRYTTERGGASDESLAVRGGLNVAF